MASYTVNKKGVAKAKALIDARQYILESDWGESQPSADDENTYLEKHSWDEYAEWHLGLPTMPPMKPKVATPLSSATSAASTGRG